jgi:hypothetical protein
MVQGNRAKEKNKTTNNKRSNSSCSRGMKWKDHFASHKKDASRLDEEVRTKVRDMSLETENKARCLFLSKRYKWDMLRLLSTCTPSLSVVTVWHLLVCPCYAPRPLSSSRFHSFQPDVWCSVKVMSPFHCTIKARTCKNS